ncbi:hypothetical protein [Jidongwangia harbinensis]|uniref:hypothetical protein n=1 Tax=Jidongwangia harbinensis TaxID=2878561 RepID=UPI001CD9E46E|nr:hypothetical protein [Jidongwangia harbinensis]MCA2217430.1 hypothetical protein [Jidongwangia harbinensis]
MRTARRLLRGILVTTLGLTLAGTATAVPARAAGADYYGYVRVIVTAFDAGEDGIYTVAELNALVEQVIAVVNGSETDLLGRLNDELVNDIQASSESALAKVEMLRVPWLAGPAINGMHDAAYRAKRHLATVHESDLALDSVGRAVIALFNVLHTVLLVVDAEEGSRLAPGVRPPFREALEYLIQEMTPECRAGSNTHAGIRTYDCQFGGRTVHAQYFAVSNAYTIDGSDPIPGHIDERLVVEYLMRDTVWQVANETLAELISEGVPRP